MEPITTTAIAYGAWELIGKPFAEKARDFYSEKVLEFVPKLWDKFTSLNDDEQEIIEAVIVEMPEEIRKDEVKFQEYLINNLKIDNQQRVVHAKTYIENFHNHGTTNIN